MNHDLLHIQGKPYVLVPLHEYRVISGGNNEEAEDSRLPQELLDKVFSRQESPVKVVRKFRGMTQAELADASGLSRPYLTEIETGRKDGSVHAIKSIAGALDVPVGLLV